MCCRFLTSLLVFVARTLLLHTITSLYTMTTHVDAFDVIEFGSETTLIMSWNLLRPFAKFSASLISTTGVCCRSSEERAEDLLACGGDSTLKLWWCFSKTPESGFGLVFKLSLSSGPGPSEINTHKYHGLWHQSSALLSCSGFASKSQKVQSKHIL